MPTISTNTNSPKRVLHQSSITGYLTHAREGSGHNEHNDRAKKTSGSRSQTDRTSDSAAPILPPSVQANLLSVGMRVRKSVPEGYKTHRTAAAHLPSIQTTATSTSTKTAPSTTTTMVPRDTVPPVYQHPRELLPYCGLHKIGGFAEQPVTNVHLYDTEAEKPVNLFPLPAEAFNTPFSASAQNRPHATSSGSPAAPPHPLNPHKRSWEEGDEEKEILGGAAGRSVAHNTTSSTFIFAFPMSVSEDEVPVSPLSSTPAHSLHTGPTSNPSPQAALRPFAQPKTRKGNTGGLLIKENPMDIEIENAEEMVREDGVAGFLRPWSEGVREVEMGGV